MVDKLVKITGNKPFPHRVKITVEALAPAEGNMHVYTSHLVTK